MTFTSEKFDQSFTHHTIQVNGVRLHYVIGGKGDLVVLLHGYAQTWYEWRKIMPALAEHYTVIAPDLRGAGDSDKPLTGYDKRSLADDIYQLVKQLGFQQVYLVGHDIGLMVAYAYAAAHPDDVKRLVVIDAPIPGVEPWEEVITSPMVWHFAFHAVPNLPEALVAGRERTYLSTGFYKALSYNPVAITETDIDEYVRCYSAPGGMRSGFEYFRTFAEDVKHNKEYAQQKLKMPVLALGGAQSLGGIMVSQMQTVAADVQGGVIAQCGHWVIDERPEELTQQLLTFFGQDQ